jgi:hypothetical protein
MLGSPTSTSPGNDFSAGADGSRCYTGGAGLGINRDQARFEIAPKRRQNGTNGAVLFLDRSSTRSSSPGDHPFLRPTGDCEIGPESHLMQKFPVVTWPSSLKFRFNRTEWHRCGRPELLAQNQVCDCRRLSAIRNGGKAGCQSRSHSRETTSRKPLPRNRAINSAKGIWPSPGST